MTPRRRTLIVDRLSQANNGPITLVYGSPNYPKQHYTPHDVPAGDNPAGEVYAFKPLIAQVDVNKIGQLVDDGVGGTFNLTQEDHDLVRNMQCLTKVGSTDNRNDRFSRIAYPNPLTDVFGFEAAESADCRHDERLCHGALYNGGQGYPQNHLPGQNLGVPAAPHVSGEWVRCSQNQREDVRISTHGRNQQLGETPNGTHLRDGALTFPVVMPM